MKRAAQAGGSFLSSSVPDDAAAGMPNGLLADTARKIPILEASLPENLNAKAQTPEIAKTGMAVLQQPILAEAIETWIASLTGRLERPESAKKHRAAAKAAVRCFLSAVRWDGMRFDYVKSISMRVPAGPAK